MQMNQSKKIQMARSTETRLYW